MRDVAVLLHDARLDPAVLELVAVEVVEVVGTGEVLGEGLGGEVRQGLGDGGVRPFGVLVALHAGLQREGAAHAVELVGKGGDVPFLLSLDRLLAAQAVADGAAVVDQAVDAGVTRPIIVVRGVVLPLLVVVGRGVRGRLAVLGHAAVDGRVVGKAALLTDAVVVGVAVVVVLLERELRVLGGEKGAEVDGVILRDLLHLGGKRHEVAGGIRDLRGVGRGVTVAGVAPEREGNRVVAGGALVLLVAGVQPLLGGVERGGAHAQDRCGAPVVDGGRAGAVVGGRGVVIGDGIGVIWRGVLRLGGIRETVVDGKSVLPVGRGLERIGAGLGVPAASQPGRLFTSASFTLLPLPSMTTKSEAGAEPVLSFSSPTLATIV